LACWKNTWLVEMTAFMHNRWNKIRRGLSAWRASLRRKRAAIVLCVPLLFLLAEPLTCIFHCDVWMSRALHSFSAMQHHHDHLHMMPAEMAAMNAPPTSAALITPGADMATACFMRGQQSDGSPVHMPPSPVHDALPALLGLLAVALVCIAAPIMIAGAPPFVTSPPPWRPPILFTS
jgi:hypothetical protein